MLYVDTLDEAAAAAAAGIDMLSIIQPVWTPAMREAAGRCFVQIGLLYGQLCTYEDYLRAAHAALQIRRRLLLLRRRSGHHPRPAGRGPPGDRPCRADPVQERPDRRLQRGRQDRRERHDGAPPGQGLEPAGAIGAELDVVPDRVAAEISRRTPLLMLSMGAGPRGDGQCLFAEDVLGYRRGHRPRHAKVYRDFAAEYRRLQQERIAPFKEFATDVESGAYPGADHVVSIADDEFAAFTEQLPD